MTNLPDEFEVLDGGEFEVLTTGVVVTAEELLNQGGATLDGANMTDVVRLRGSDGKYYQMTFEAVISEAGRADFNGWAANNDYDVVKEDAYRNLLAEMGTDSVYSLDTLNALAQRLGRTNVEAEDWLIERGYLSAPILDKCSICHGEKGGTPGNENVVDGVVMCDYCHAKLVEERQP